MKNVVLTPRALEEIGFWAKEDRRILLRILDLINDIQRDPFSGIGKPEPLRHEFKGLWSRRIDNTHRLVYSVETKQIVIAACRFHYSK